MLKIGYDKVMWLWLVNQFKNHAGNFLRNSTVCIAWTVEKEKLQQQDWRVEHRHSYLLTSVRQGSLRHHYWKRFHQNSWGRNKVLQGHKNQWRSKIVYSDLLEEGPSGKVHCARTPGAPLHPKPGASFNGRHVLNLANFLTPPLLISLFFISYFFTSLLYFFIYINYS